MKHCSLARGAPRHRAKGKKSEYVAGKPEINHLYDVGRNIHTEFDPKNHREQYYTMKHGFEHDKRMGTFRTASQEVGVPSGRWRRAGAGRSQRGTARARTRR